MALAGQKFVDRALLIDVSGRQSCRWERRLIRGIGETLGFQAQSGALLKRAREKFAGVKLQRDLSGVQVHGQTALWRRQHGDLAQRSVAVAQNKIVVVLSTLTIL